MYLATPLVNIDGSRFLGQYIPTSSLFATFAVSFNDPHIRILLDQLLESVTNLLGSRYCGDYHPEDSVETTARLIIALSSPLASPL